MFEANADIIIRILLSIGLGFVIGLERELTNKWAGLRTHMLVCLGSCVFTILSIYAFPKILSETNPMAFGDPARIAAQILTGIGFIGGGTILRYRATVYGLTTAATLWISAAIGMAAGTGFYATATLATAFAVITLVGIRKLEQGLLASFVEKGIRLGADLICPNENLPYAINKIYAEFPNLIEIKHYPYDEQSTKISFVFDTVRGKSISDIGKNLSKIKHIKSVAVQKIETSD